ncbi:hypothetical protein [Bartonella sp. AC53GZZY]|uniref:hypothetical protein n=1 Tax=Bartonella sp. AC53GZZY TaxID=3243456 RepID=UPI0035CED104
MGTGVSSSTLKSGSSKSYWLVWGCMGDTTISSRGDCHAIFGFGLPDSKVR